MTEKQLYCTLDNGRHRFVGKRGQRRCEFCKLTEDAYGKQHGYWPEGTGPK